VKLNDSTYPKKVRKIRPQMKSPDLSVLSSSGLGIKEPNLFPMSAIFQDRRIIKPSLHDFLRKRTRN
jgi:hypothetical protein